MRKALFKIIPIFICCSLVLFVVGVSAVEISNIKSNASSTSQATLSLYGGDLIIGGGGGGTGFFPSLQSVLTITVGGSTCTVNGGESSNFKLTCRTAQALLPEGNQLVVITIDGTQVTCKDLYSCYVLVSREYTPYLSGVSPPWLTVDDFLNVEGIFRAASGSLINEASVLNSLSSPVTLVPKTTTVIDPNKFEKQVFGLPSTIRSGGNVITLRGGNGSGYSKYSPQNGDYDFWVVPLISSVSPSSGTAYGQNLVISGKGFPDSPKVFVGNAPCEVSSASSTLISCSYLDTTQTLIKQGSTLFETGNGVEVQKFVSKGFSSLSQVKLLTTITEEIPVSTSVSTSELNVGSEIFTTYFRPAATGSHVFNLFIPLEETATIEISAAISSGTTNLSSISVSNILSYSYNPLSAPPESDVWHYPRVSSTARSLQKDSLYKLVVKRDNIKDITQYFSVGIDAPFQSGGGTNKKCLPDMIQVQLGNTPYKAEVIQFKFYGINTTNGGKWVINVAEVSKQTRVLLWNEETVNLETFLKYDLGWQASVARIMVDSTGADTQDSLKLSGYRYLVTLLLPRDSTRAPDIISSLKGTSGTTPPTSVTILTAASATMSGSFKLIVNGLDTGYLPHTTSSDDLWKALVYYAKVDSETQVVASGVASSGLFTILLWGPTEYVFVGSSLGSAFPVTITKVREKEDCTIESLRSIPFDRLLQYTNASPSVRISGGAVCTTSVCQFTVSDLTARMSSYSLSSENVLKVILTQALPSNVTKVKLYLGSFSCEVSASSISLTSLQCSLTSLQAGKFQVQAEATPYGLVPPKDSLNTLTVNPVVSSTQVVLAAGNLGETQVTISGNYFSPTSTSVSIAGNNCSVSFVNSTQITCLTTLQGGTYDVTLKVNGIDFVFVSQYKSENPPEVPVITKINQTSASPVEKTTLKVTGKGFGVSSTGVSAFIMSTDNLTSYSCSISDQVIIDTEFSCVLPGGKSGSYNFYVSRENYGVSVDKITFKYELVVTDSQPKVGSIAGGTEITITGRNFSPVFSSNLVFIGDSGSLCEVTSASTTTLKCTTPALTTTEIASLNSTGTLSKNLYLVAKLTEEAVIEGGADISFNYQTSITPTVTDITPLEVKGGQTVTVTGTNFNQQGQTVSVKVDGNETSFSLLSSTKITFSAPSISYNLAASLVIKIGNIGYPSYTFTPTLKYPIYVDSVSPSTISQGGGILKVTGSAFFNDMQVFFDSYACPITSFKSSSQFECELAQTSTSLNTKIKMNVYSTSGSQIFSCSSSSSVCQTKVLPSISSVLSSISPSSTLKSSGTGTIDFLMVSSLTVSSLTGKETITGSLVSSVDSTVKFQTTSSSSLGSFNFRMSFSNVAPGVYYPKIQIGDRGYAFNSLGTMVQVDLNSGNFGSELTESSFMGGAQVSVSLGSNQPPIDKAAKVEVSICGKPCTNVQFSSNKLLCQSPSYTSKTTQSLYSVNSPDYLVPETLIADNPLGNAASVLDEENDSFYSSTSSKCYVGYDFGANFKAEVSKVIFVPVTDEEGDFLLVDFKGVTLQKSDDLVSWSSVVVVQESDLVPGYNQITTSTLPLGRYFRLKGSSTNQCRFSLLKIYGLVYSQLGSLSNGKVSCPVTLSVGGLPSPLSLAASVQYMQDKTVTLNSLNPSSGSSNGGDKVTLTFSSVPLSTPAIKLGGYSCTNVTAVSSTVYTCVTAAAVSQSTNVEVIFSSGYAAIAIGVSFTYFSRWSDPKTWGGESPPRAGDLAYIPEGMTVLLDESTSILDGVLIMGKLVFDRKDLELHANYIILNGGTLEIGTESDPFRNKTVITLYGDPATDKVFPFAGSKLIYGRSCNVLLYGEPRVTYTRLSTTSLKGSKKLVLQDAVDWRVGEKVAIGPTGYDFEEAEEGEIQAISADGKTITLTNALSFEHGAYFEDIGSGRVLKMSAEVALLDRSILIQGDEDSDRTKYGAHVMIFKESVGIFSFVEVYRGGQQSVVARYPLHFHISGDVLGSYISGCSIHHSYSRAVTVHGVYYLLVENNVAYDITGHAYFIEDGIERYNIIRKNLGMKIRRNFIFLSSDKEVSVYWITNPTNFLDDNIASGSEGHGFWFDLVENPTGPSATDDVCPRGLPLGSFDRNEAHSVGGYGLFIFEEWIPRESPCDDWENFDLNPPIASVLNDFVAYKNVMNGVMAERVGAVSFNNFTLADNLIANFEIGINGLAPNTSNTFTNSVIIGLSTVLAGMSGTKAGAIQPTEAVGVWGPRTEGFIIDGIRFKNFPSGLAALCTCSHCYDIYAQDSTRNSLFTKNLMFEGVQKRVTWTDPERDIILDQDGTLTNLKGGGWVTPYFPHNDVEACTRNDAVYSGLVCNNSIQIRRLAFYNLVRADNFYGVEMKIRRLSVPFESEVGPEAEYSEISFRLRDSPSNSWTAPFVTGEIYNLHWRLGLDWEQITIESTNLYQPQDHPIYLQFNYTDERDTFVSNGSQIPIASLPSDPKTSVEPFGTWANNASTNQFLVIFTGTESDETSETERLLYMEGLRCTDCGYTYNSKVYQGSTWYYWSNPTSWPSGKVPVQGENVEIPNNIKMYLDVNPPALNQLTIKGTLQVLDFPNITKLSAGYIFIRENALFQIGSESAPFANKFTIELLGKREDPSITLGEDQQGGNKVMIVTGELTIYSASAKKESITRLSTHFTTSSKVINLRTKPGWEVGDEIVIGSSGFDDETESFTVKSVDSTGKVFTLDRSPTYAHSGFPGPIYSDPLIGTLDMAAEVGLLTHNVKIIGGDDSDLGGTLFNPKYFIGGISVQGEIFVQGVEFYKMGQQDTQRAGINFDGNTMQNTFRNISNHHSPAFWLNLATAGYIEVTDSVFYKALKLGVKLNDSPHDSVLSRNIFMTVEMREFIEGQVFDINTVIFWSSENTPLQLNFTISDNIISGGEAGFTYTGVTCSQLETYSNTIYRNSFHSNGIGQCPLNYEGEEEQVEDNICMYIGDAVAYRNREDGIVSYANSTSLVAERLILASNKNGVTLNLGWADNDYVNPTISLKNSVFYGTIGDRPADYEVDISGLRIPVATDNMKGTLPNAYQMPMYMPMSNALLGATLTIEDCIVRNLQSSNNVTFIQSNLFAGDTSAIVSIGTTSYEYVNVENLFYFVPPFDNFCSSDICSGLANIVIRVDSFQNLPPFHVVPDSELAEVTGNLGDCVSVPSWAGFRCSSEFGLLSFESLDDDFETRVFAPVTVDGPDIGTSNTLYNYKDYYWTSFWRSDLFPSVFNAAVRSGQRYEISSSGTFATKSEFYFFKPAHLTGEAVTESWIVVELFPKNSFYLSLSVGGVVISPETISSTSSINTNAANKVCGTNIYNVETQSIEFILTSDPSCVVTIGQSSVVSFSMRLSISVSDFYDEYGLADFVTMMTAFLGLEYSQLRIASVQEGSTILNFHILETQDGPTISGEEVTKKIIVGVKKNQLDFGGILLNIGYVDSTGSMQMRYFEDDSFLESASGWLYPVMFGFIILLLVIIIVLGAILFIRSRLAKQPKGNKSPDVSKMKKNADIITPKIDSNPESMGFSHDPGFSSEDAFKLQSEDIYKVPLGEKIDTQP